MEELFSVLEVSVLIVPLSSVSFCEEAEGFCSTDFWICRAEQLKGARLKESQDPDACRIHKH